MNLVEYVQKFSERGECKCGHCGDKGNLPDPVGLPADAPPEERVSDILSGTGHTADLMFFKVAKKEGATAEEFIRLTKEHKGEFQACDPLDGAEHNYLELGAWIGDQGGAMQYMGLGSLLGVFSLLTPRTMLPKELADEMGMQMAGQGMVAVQLKKGASCPK